MAQCARGAVAVAVIRLSNPPLNALSSAVVQALEQGVKKADADPAVKAVVICGANGIFSAGADIRGFSSIQAGDRPSLASVIDLIERSEKPMVAAIEGMALGGGLEVALGCHYRIAHVQLHDTFGKDPISTPQTPRRSSKQTPAINSEEPVGEI